MVPVRFDRGGRVSASWNRTKLDTSSSRLDPRTGLLGGLLLCEHSESSDYRAPSGVWIRGIKPGFHFSRRDVRRWDRCSLPDRACTRTTRQWPNKRMNLLVGIHLK